MTISQTHAALVAEWQNQEDHIYAEITVNILQNAKSQDEANRFVTMMKAFSQRFRQQHNIQQKAAKTKRASPTRLPKECHDEIRRLYMEGMGQKEIARRYNVTPAAISNLVCGKSGGGPRITRVPIRARKKEEAKSLSRRLSVEAYKEIRELYAQGIIQKELAKRYNISQSAVSQIIHGKR